MNKNIVIELCAVEKYYGVKAALKSVDLQIRHGELIGIAGGQEAGKTALLDVMTGMQDADAGFVHVLGKELTAHDTEVKEQIGIPMSDTNAVESMTVNEVLELYQSFNKRKYNLDELIPLVGLEHVRYKIIKGLSAAHRQQLKLAVAMVSDPAVIVLDEPTIGLDMGAKEAYWQLLQRLNSRGKTIVIASHDMAQAQQYCSRIAIMRRGEIVAYGSPLELISQLSGGGMTMEAVYMHHYELK